MSNTKIEWTMEHHAPDYYGPRASSTDGSSRRLKCGVACVRGAPTPVLLHLSWSNAALKHYDPVAAITSKGATPSMLRDLALCLTEIADNLEGTLKEGRLQLETN